MCFCLPVFSLHVLPDKLIISNMTISNNFTARVFPPWDLTHLFCAFMGRGNSSSVDGGF